ncbi:MAG: response regulator [Roseococcus sp.]
MTDAEPAESNALSVLIVDDEANVAGELADAAEDEGYVVHKVNSAAAALAILAEHPEIGVMISDIRMPDCDGLELTRRALDGRDDASALEVILITGHATLDDAVLAVRTGAFDFVRKPFRLQQIFDAVARAIARAIGRRRVAAAVLAMEALRAGPAHTLTDETIQGGPAILLGLMHELRTPLVPILGFAEILENQRCSPADTVEYAKLIGDGGKQLLSTVDDLVLLTQIERGDIRLAPTTQTASVFLQALAQGHQSTSALMGKSVQVKLGRDFSFLADGPMALRALNVLLRIALQLSPRGTTITLAAAHDGHSTRIAIGPDASPHALALLAPATFAEDVARQIAPLGSRFARSVIALHHGTTILSGDEQSAFSAVVTLPDGAA